MTEHANAGDGTDRSGPVLDDLLKRELWRDAILAYLFRGGVVQVGHGVRARSKEMSALCMLVDMHMQLDQEEHEAHHHRQRTTKRKREGGGGTSHICLSPPNPETSPPSGLPDIGKVGRLLKSLCTKASLSPPPAPPPQKQKNGTQPRTDLLSQAVPRYQHGTSRILNLFSERSSRRGGWLGDGRGGVVVVCTGGPSVVSRSCTPYSVR